jgi:hypothetical protein
MAILAALLLAACPEPEPDAQDVPSDAGSDVQTFDIAPPEEVTEHDVTIPPPTPVCETAADCEAVLAEPGPCQTRECSAAGQCLYVGVTDGTPCDAGSPCYTEQQCSGGFCLGGVDVDCSDQNACTNDSCDFAQGCVHSPRIGPCNDDDECTIDEYCKDGACGNGTDICPAQCGNGSCQTAKGETCATCPDDCGACSDGCTESAFPGCEGCACEQCVCDANPACCTEAWTTECVAACEACGSCTPCGDGTCSESDGETCESCPSDCGACPTGCGAREEPGCAGCGCEECVCEASPFCCEVAWDEACVELAALLCGAGCASTCGDGACEPGESCEECVCALVPSCCTTAWSPLCVTACATECGGSCD